MKRCCVIGHRKIENETKLKTLTIKTIKDLIENKNVTIFLFGSHSAFTDLCYDIVTELKSKYHQLIRIYVRAEYPIISDSYKRYLSGFYEDSYYYDKSLITAKFSYVERNKRMIKNSEYCLFYYNEEYKLSNNKKSGTSLAYNYAKKLNKTIINVYK